MFTSIAFLFLAAGLPTPAAPASTAPTLTPLRTNAEPKIDRVVGDAQTLRTAVDRFFALHAQMEGTRDEFSNAVHGTLARLGPTAVRPPPGSAAQGCSEPVLEEYGRARKAGAKYLEFGTQLEARFRDLRRGDDFGDTLGLTPDYRRKIAHAQDLYNVVRRDFREMRFAFHDQLDAELKHAGCRPGLAGHAGSDAATDSVRGASNPDDPAAWELQDPDVVAAAGGDFEDAHPGPRARVARPRPQAQQSVAGASSIWIEIDNSRCRRPSALSIDGASFAPVAAQKKVAVRTHAGPRELCVLPAGDARKCGDPGTLRRAYLSDGWSLTVRCN